MGLAGAFLWAVAQVGWSNRNSPDWPWSTPLYAAYATLVASWFVLPLGAFVGTLLPRLIANRSTTASIARGFLLGALVGFIAATVTTALFFVLPVLTDRTTVVDFAAWRRYVTWQFCKLLASMSTVSALWTGLWAGGLERFGRDLPQRSGVPNGAP